MHIAHLLCPLFYLTRKQGSGFFVLLLFAILIVHSCNHSRETWRLPLMLKPYTLPTHLSLSLALSSWPSFPCLVCVCVQVCVCAHVCADAYAYSCTCRYSVCAHVWGGQRKT